MSDKNALVVEDTEANRVFFERLLKQAGYNVHSAASGKEAIAIAKKLDSLALGVFDMEIPDTNGLELTIRIRKKFEQACLVVATMHDERSLMQSSFDKGCDVFLVKPHGFMELYKRLTTEGHDQMHENRPLVIDQYGPRKFQAIASSQE